ncbi:MAG: hypothetical protein ABIQ13_04420 [Pedococcus sp.]
MLTGLEGGERFVYADPDEDGSKHSRLALLVSQQFDAEAASRDGRLVRMPVGDFYSPHAPARITATPQADGFAAVRLATQASAAMGHLRRERLMASEEELAGHAGSSVRLRVGTATTQRPARLLVPWTP